MSIDILGQEALGVAENRAIALGGIAVHLPKALQPEVFDEALAMARRISSDTARANVLAKLAQYSPAPWKNTMANEAFAAVAKISHADWRGDALAALAPFLLEGWLREALACIHAMTFKSPVEAIAKLVSTNKATSTRSDKCYTQPSRYTQSAYSVGQVDIVPIRIVITRCLCHSMHYHRRRWARRSVESPGVSPCGRS